MNDSDMWAVVVFACSADVHLCDFKCVLHVVASYVALTFISVTSDNYV